MAYNVLQAITEAYNIADINPKGFKTLTSDQTETGLRLFNVMLSDKTVDNDLLLYWDKLDGVFTPSVDSYQIDRLISIETLTFFLSDGTVRYPTQVQGIDQFMGSARAMNAESLPVCYWCNKNYGGATLYVYFPPNEAYPYQIWGQFQLASVTLFEDISTRFEPFYIEFLTCQLADRLCVHFGYSVPEELTRTLLGYRKKITGDGKQQDMSCATVSTLTNLTLLSWAQVNIGGAYTVGPSR